MGQRSQIYIRIMDNYNENPILYAKYYSWNFAERMISRAKYGIEYIKKNIGYITLDSTKKKINRIFDVKNADNYMLNNNELTIVGECIG